MKQIRGFVPGVGAALSVAWVLVPAARANVLFDFDFDGAGSNSSVQTIGFDSAEGNALLQGFNLPAGASMPVTIPFLFQNRLNAHVSGLLIPGDLTVVGSMPVHVGNPYSGASLGPGFMPSANNFLEIWSQPIRNSNSLAGTGYNDGTLILRAHFVSSTDYFIQPISNAQTLDQFGANNYSSLSTRGWSGGGTSDLIVDFADPLYFKAPLPSINSLHLVTSYSAPYVITDPSARFVTAPNGAAPSLAGAGVGAASLGTVNGALLTAGGGPDVQFSTNFRLVFETMVRGGIAYYGLRPDSIDAGSTQHFALTPGTTFLPGDPVKGLGTQRNLWFDPLPATGLSFEVLSGPLFKTIVMPASLDPDGNYELWLPDGAGGFVFSQILHGDNRINLPVGGVSAFQIRGITPSAGLDPSLESVSAGLMFNSGDPVTMTITSLPEPTTLLITMCGAAALCARPHRRRR